jgi:hypothetical protein
MKFLLLCAVLSMSGCASFNRHSVLPPVTAKIPQSLRQACAGVIYIPERDLTAGEIARLWAKDRTALLICARRHGALSKAVAVLEGQP